MNCTTTRTVEFLSMYSHPTETIYEAFVKAYESALVNYEVASVPAQRGFDAQATSLAVLALEEVGKMILIDGLLFARTGDERYKRYKSGQLNHRDKLNALELYPLLFNYLMRFDPRWHETRFKTMAGIVMVDFKKTHQRMVDQFGSEFSFQHLDSWKQKGFYSHDDNGTLKSNREGINSQGAKAVLEFTWRVTDSLRFVLDKSLEHYKSHIFSVRDKLDEVTLRRKRKAAEEIVKNIFGLESS